MNKIEILNNNKFTVNNNTILYIKGKINLQKNQIFTIKPIVQIVGSIYIVVDNKNHNSIKKFIENSPVINNKIIIYDHFGNRLNYLNKERNSNKFGNVSIKTKTSPTVSNIIIPEHTEYDLVLVFSSSHFSEKIINKDIKIKGIEEDLSEINCTGNVNYFLDESLFDNHFRNDYNKEDIIYKSVYEEEIIECNKMIGKYQNNGQNIIEYYFGKAVNINENNIHSIINIPHCKVIDINTEIISGSFVDFTIRSNGIELLSTGNSEFQLLAYIENDKPDIILKIDDKEYFTSKVTIKEFPELDFDYVLKLLNILKLINLKFFDDLNIESLTSQDKLQIFDFIFNKTNVSSFSRNISTKFFLSTFKVMSQKLKMKIESKSIFYSQHNLNRIQTLTRVPDLQFYENSTCQRQHSVPFNN